jgi:hypothetical protein
MLTSPRCLSLSLYLTDRQQGVFNNITPTVQCSGLKNEYLGAMVVDFLTTREDQLSASRNNLTQRTPGAAMNWYGASSRDAV